MVAASLIVVIAAGMVIESSRGLGRRSGLDDGHRQLAQALGGNPAAAPSSNKASPSSRPSGPQAELMGLLARGRAESFSARYAVLGTPSGPAGGLELWRRPPLARQDGWSGPGSPSTRSAVLALRSGVVSCAQIDENPWTCVRRPDLAAEAVDTLPGPGPNEVVGHRVSVRDDSVGGHRARCFVIDSRQEADVCLTSEGIPLRSSAVPENLARQFPGNPFLVDVTKAADQFGLRAVHFEDLLNNIIPGSGWAL